MTTLLIALTLLAQDPAHVDEARKLLADAGYAGGKDFPAVTILYNNAETHRTLAAWVQECWKKNLGIDVIFRGADWKGYLDALVKRDYQVARRGWIADYPDPNAFLEILASGGGNNNTGWTNKEYDALIEQASRQPEPGKRMDLLMKAEKLLLDEMPVIPVYFYVSQNMWKPDVRGLHANALNVHPIAEVAKGDGSGTLTMCNHAEPATLDPALARGMSEHRLLIGLFEGLMSYDPETLQPVPGAAGKVRVSPDCQVYIFTLRDCRWSDGKAVTARDFEYAWKRVLDPKTGADYAHLLYVLKGGEDFNRGKADEFAVGVRAKDDRTLVVELERPTPYFLDLLPLFSFYPVRKDAVEKHGAEWTKPGNLVGNGPFRLKEWVPNDHILLEKSTTYWNAGRVRQKLVKWLPTEESAAAFDLYEKGECDYLDAVPIEKAPELRSRADFHGSTYLGTYFLSFNVTLAPFSDKRVRRALALAIDRAGLCEKILRGGQRPAWHFVPPGLESRGYRSEPFAK